FGDFTEVQLGIRREQDCHQRIRAAADVSVGVFKNDAVGRFGSERWRGSVEVTVHTGPSRRHRLENDQAYVRWTTPRTDPRVNRGAGPPDRRRQKLACSNRVEIAQVRG